jgi:hypothetical protein
MISLFHALVVALVGSRKSQFVLHHILSYSLVGSLISWNKKKVGIIVLHMKHELEVYVCEFGCIWQISFWICISTTLVLCYSALFWKLLS